LQEFEKAVNQRDNLIEHLTSSLEQALSARDAVTAQLNALNSMQLNNPVINNVNLQQKVSNFIFLHFAITNLVRCQTLLRINNKTNTKTNNKLIKKELQTIGLRNILLKLKCMFRLLDRNLQCKKLNDKIKNW